MAVSVRSIFTTVHPVNFAPWIQEHMNNVHALVNHILGKEENPSESSPAHRSEEVRTHHHYHHWDYGWGGPWWGFGWGGPSYSPVIINNGNFGRREKEEENHTALAIISTVAFFVLSFFCGKAYYAYDAFSKQLNDHEYFTTEFNAAAQRLSGSGAQKALEVIHCINRLTKDVLEERQSEAFKNLALLISGLASALLIATGSIFKVTMLRYTGLFAIFPLGSYALFRIGMAWNDDFQKQQALKIQQALENYQVI